MITPSSNLGEYKYNNGKGCEVDIVFLGTPDNSTAGLITVLYVGYFANEHLDWFLESDTCDRRASQQFLAIWARSKQKQDITALFCEASYAKQDVSITISTKDGRPDDASLSPLNKAQVLEESEFNSTAFTYLISTGVPPLDIKRDFARETIVELTQSIDPRVTWPITPMVGYGLAPSNYSLESMSNASVLQEAFSAAHKLLFSATVPQLLAKSNAAPTKAGTIKSVQHGIVVSRPIAATVEILLLVVSLMIGCTIWTTNSLKSKLAEEPSRYGVIPGALKSSEPLLRQFIDRDCLDDDALRQSLTGERYKLITEVRAAGETASTIEIVSANQRHVRSQADRGFYAPIRPIPLRIFTGLGLVAVLLAGLGVLVYLKRLEQAQGGLLIPLAALDYARETDRCRSGASD
jgi:hypothetical protein